MPRKTLADLRRDPPNFTLDARARLTAMTDDAIDEAAKTDADAPEWTDAALDRAHFARAVRQARAATGLTQSLFAARYHITLSRLKDWEQGRFKPDSVALTYFKVIRRDPDAVARALVSEG